jgi:hypothetical protein
MQRSIDITTVSATDKAKASFKISLLGALTRMHLVLAEFFECLNKIEFID